MSLHINFLQKIAIRRRGMVGRIILDLHELKIENGMIKNFPNYQESIEQIASTIFFLEKEGLVITNGNTYRPEIPSFNLEEYVQNVQESKRGYTYDRMRYVQELLNKYWPLEISITPAFYNFLDNGFKTDRELKDFRDTWLPILVALLTSFLTAYFTAKFDNEFKDIMLFFN
jgi:hypothetical protein